MLIAVKTKPMNTVEATWNNSSQKAKSTALERERFLAPLLALIRGGKTKNQAVSYFVLGLGSLFEEISSKKTSRSTLFAWLASYEATGVAGLLPNHKGNINRIDNTKGWQGLVLELYSLSSQPSAAAVGRLIREDYKIQVSDSQVLNYINNLPSNLGKLSPARIGKKNYKLNQTQYIRRCTENMMVGDVWMADGHTIDVYLAHPNTGKPWRAELTVFMDVKSRVIVGHSLGMAESQLGVQQAFVNAIAKHKHVPPLLYVDNGSGFKAKLMNDESTGLYTRVGVQDVIYALPGNARAKGWIERFFGVMEQDLNVFYADAFCGYSANKEAVQKYHTNVRTGKIRGISHFKWLEDFENWLVKYHNRPHPENSKKTRMEVYNEGFIPIPPHQNEIELGRLETQRAVRKGGIQMHNREYFHQDLYDFSGKQVIVEYDLHTDELVWVYDLQHRFIATASKINAKEAIPTSRLQEAKEKAAAAAVKRLHKKAEEIEQRHTGAIYDGTQAVEVIQHNQEDVEILELEDNRSEDILIDLTQNLD